MRVSEDGYGAPWWNRQSDPIQKLFEQSFGFHHSTELFGHFGSADRSGQRSQSLSFVSARYDRGELRVSANRLIHNNFNLFLLREVPCRGPSKESRCPELGALLWCPTLLAVSCSGEDLT